MVLALYNNSGISRYFTCCTLSLFTYKMLKNTNNRLCEVQNLLDSDDELPSNYHEEPDIPAYLDDQRFDAVQFNWVKNDRTRSIPAKKDMVPNLKIHEFDSFIGNTCGKNVLKRGLLNEEDICCMKGVAAHTTDATALLWFIDFLMYKDLQSDYKFLRSCLVSIQVNHGNPRKVVSQIFFPKGHNYFEILVK